MRQRFRYLVISEAPNHVRRQVVTEPLGVNETKGGVMLSDQVIGNVLPTSIGVESRENPARIATITNVPFPSQAIRPSTAQHRRHRPPRRELVVLKPFQQSKDPLSRAT